MYNDYYGFTQVPFNLTPDPSFLYLSMHHREALNHLMYGIHNRKGFIQLTGEVGAGKTTICRQILARLDQRFKTALILNPCMTSLQLMRSIVSEFGLEVLRQDRKEYLNTLNAFLLDLVARGEDAVLIIDESQDMTLELLEQVRLLSNLETDQRKLLQIVLIGQSELRTKLNDPRLRQLRQRITVRYHLKSLSRWEMDEYIHRRLQVAGGNGSPAFSPWALRRIYRYSRGTPRLVNALCDMTLLAGYAAQRKYLTRPLVCRAINELEGSG